MNPYTDQNFWQFFSVFFSRLYLLMTGKLGFGDLVSDEVQIFVLVLLTITCTLVGGFLVLKKMTMMANSLSHTILLGIVVTYLLMSWFSGSRPHLEEVPLSIWILASFLTGILTTVATQTITKFLRLSEEASIGLVFTTFFALGIVLVTLFTRNVHIGIEAVMGNIDALHRDDLKGVFYIFLLNLLVTTIFFSKYTIMSFDSVLAKSLGMKVGLLEYILMTQTAATAIGAFRAVGVVLFLALLVGPFLTARLLTCSLKKLITFAVLFGIFSSLISVALSRHFLTAFGLALSTAGILIVIILLVYIIAAIYRILQKKVLA